MHHGIKLAACVMAIVGVVGVTASAVAQQQPPSRAEQSIKYRTGLYQAVYWNFGPMGAAVQGKAPYDKDAFAKQAARVAMLSPMLAEGFAVESPNDSKPKGAKAAIWTNKAEFDKLMQDFVTKSATLAEVAKGGDLAKIKPAFGDVGQACKACHDKFRAE